MPRRMIIYGADGQPVILDEVTADDEAQLQEQVKLNPGLLPVEELGVTGPLMVVGRETTLPSGAIDLLGIARSGEILIIECKTGPQNPDFRQALAQLLDYGSDLWGMSYETFESAVARRYFTGDRCPKNLPVSGKTTIEDAARATWSNLSDEELSLFKDAIGKQLDSGGFHYVVLAQRFTPTMEQTIRYMNATARGPRFCAVELVRFSGGGLTAFEARAVLRPQPSGSTKQGAAPLDEITFLGRVQDETHRSALREFLEACRGLGFRSEWGTAGTSIRVPTADMSEPLTIAWLFSTEGPGWAGLRGLSLGFDPWSARSRPSLSGALEEYLAAVEQLPGVQPVSSTKLRGWQISPITLAQESSRIVNILANLIAASGGSS